MAQRDYAARSGSRKKKKSAGISPVWVIIGALVVLGFATGLYFLKNSAPETVEVKAEKPAATKPKSQLPSRPEETWSYIKELESRTVPTDESALANSAKLNEKQKAELKRLQEAEKQAELEKAKQTEEAIKMMEQDKNAQLEAERRIAEEKKAEERRQAEIAKQEKAKKAEAAKIENAKKAENAKSAGGFGLQCGAFGDRPNAEALQGKLAMANLNARIVVSGKWHRVVVGPVGNRAAAVNAQKQAASVENCVIIGM